MKNEEYCNGGENSSSSNTCAFKNYMYKTIFWKTSSLIRRSSTLNTPGLNTFLVMNFKAGNLLYFIKLNLILGLTLNFNLT